MRVATSFTSSEVGKSGVENGRNLRVIFRVAIRLLLEQNQTD